MHPLHKKEEGVAALFWKLEGNETHEEVDCCN
jgi:hypothetical protein